MRSWTTVDQDLFLNDPVRIRAYLKAVRKRKTRAFFSNLFDDWFDVFPVRGINDESPEDVIRYSKGIYERKTKCEKVFTARVRQLRITKDSWHTYSS
jgi:hypothetical protein